MWTIHRGIQYQNRQDYGSSTPCRTNILEYISLDFTLHIHIQNLIHSQEKHFPYFSAHWTELRCYSLFSSVQSLSCVWLFATPWIAAHQASLSIINSQSLLKHISTESVMSSNHLILCHPLLLLPSIFPSIRVFSNESALRIRQPNTAYYHLFNPEFLNIGTIDNLGQDISFHKACPVRC